MRILATIAACLSACGSSPRTEPIAPSAGAEALVEPPWELVAVPDAPGGSLDVLFAEPIGDGWLVGVGGVRVALEGAQPAAASDRTEHPIVEASRLGESWVFVTSAGEVYRSETPLGDLTLVGTTTRWLGAVTGSEHRLALLDEEGHLHVGDATSLSSVDAPLPVIDASFATAELGARIDVDGRVHATLDGGTTWTEVALPADAGTPTVALALDGAMLVGTSADRWLRIEPPGTAVSASPPTLPAEPEIDDATRRAARDLVLELETIASELSPDGHIVVDGDEGLVLLPEGTELGYANCPEGVRWWNGRLVMWCGTNLFAWDGAEFTLMPAVVDDRPTVLDPAGDRAVAAGPCAPGGWYDVYDSICVGTGGTRVELPFPQLLELVGLSGDEVVGVVRTPDHGRALSRIDLRAGRVRPIAVEGGAEPATAHVADDGTVFATSGEDRVYVGTATDGLRAIPLPAEALDPHLVVVDRSHWVVEGDGTLFLTSDAGASWEEVPSTDGLELHAERCHGRSCDLGSLLWAPAGASPLAPRRILSAQTAPVPEASRVLEAALRCDVPARWAGHPTPPALPDLPASTFIANGGLDVRGAPDGWTEGELRATLWGLDRGERYSVEARSGVVPPMPPLAESPHAGVSVRLLAVGPQVGLLERRRRGSTRWPTELIAVGPSMAPTLLPSFEELSHASSRAPEVTAILPLDDGSLAIRLTHGLEGAEAGGTGRRPDLVLVVAPDGALTSHAFESGRVPTRRALAADSAARVGLLSTRAESSFFLPIDGSAPVAIPSLPAVVDRVCTPADVARHRVVGPVASGGWVGVVHAIDDVPVSQVVALLEDGAACLESALVHGPVVPSRSEIGHAALDLSIDGGAVRGTLLSPGGSLLDVRCALETEPAEPRDADLRMGTLADGSIGLVAAYRPPTAWLFGRLDGDRLETTTVDSPSDGWNHLWFVDGAGEPTASTGAEIYSAVDSRSTEGAFARMVADGTELALLSPLGTDPVSGALASAVAVAIDGVLTPSLSLGHVTTNGGALVAGTGGSHGAVVRVDDRSSGGCAFRGFRLRSGTLAARATLPSDGDCAWRPWVAGPPASRLPIAWVGASGTSTAIRVTELGGASPVEIGPPIPPSGDGGLEVLAVRSTPRPCVVYVDPVGDVRAIRVVELRRGDWYDVAPVWPSWGAAAATFDGSDVIVTSSDSPGARPDDVAALPLAARLHDGRWSPISVDPVPRDEHEDEYAEDDEYEDEEPLEDY